MSGTMAAIAKVASIEPPMKNGSRASASATAIPIAPSATMPAAPWATGQRRRCVRFTTSGPQISPMLCPATSSAFAVGPAWNQRTAMSSRNVVCAVSRTPVKTARHFSAL